LLDITSQESVVQLRGRLQPFLDLEEVQAY